MKYAHPDENLSRSELDGLQARKLQALLHVVLRQNLFYENKLAGMSPDSPLSSLPFTTREEIQRDQHKHPPYGTNLTFPPDHYSRLHQTSASTGNPLRVLDRAEDWAWWKHCWKIIYGSAGVRQEDRIVFPFSFGPFIGFWAAFESAAELGNLCLAAGGMTTTARLRYILDHSATVICCTPTYALRMAEVARVEKINIAASSVKRLIVAGEPGGSIPAIRDRIESEWGARVFDHAGMTELGPHSFECEQAGHGLHIIESEFIPEVVDPDSLRAVDEGREGELVLTNLGRHGWPLIRYRTGDLVRITRNTCACGRCFARLEGGLLGRIDDMITIRGNNVFPSAVDAIIREFAGLAEYRVRISHEAMLPEMVIEIEAVEAQVEERVAQQVRDRLHFRPVVKRVSPGSLPRFEMKARRWEKPYDRGD